MQNQRVNQQSTFKKTAMWLPVEPPPDLAESLMILKQISPAEAAAIIEEIQEEVKKQFFNFQLEEDEQRNRL